MTLPVGFLNFINFFETIFLNLIKFDMMKSLSEFNFQLAKFFIKFIDNLLIFI